MSLKNSESGVWSREKTRGAEERGGGRSQGLAGLEGELSCITRLLERKAQPLTDPGRPGIRGTAALIYSRKHIIKQVSESAVTSNLSFFFLSELFTNKQVIHHLCPTQNSFPLNVSLWWVAPVASVDKLLSPE